MGCEQEFDDDEAGPAARPECGNGVHDDADGAE